MRSLVLSPASNFLVAVQTYAPSLDFQYAVGLQGPLESIPAGFLHDSILFAGNGVRSTISVWGDYLQARYHKKRTTLDGDLAISHLGYWTVKREESLCVLVVVT